MTSTSQSNRAGRVGALALVAIFAAGLAAAPAFAETVLRLSTTGQPQSEEVAYAEAFAAAVAERTEGRVQVRVHPASALGDWSDVEEYVIQGAVEMALQPLGARFGSAGILNNFPFITTDYESITETYSEGGFVYDVVNEALAERDLRLLSVFGLATGGGGFSVEVENPKEIVPNRGIMVRVWPGGRVHGVMMEKFGYQTTPVPWADVYTGLQTGVVEGWIGSNPISAYETLPELTKTWIHYNAYFDALWMFVNEDVFQSLEPGDQQVIVEAADGLARERFQRAEQAEAEVFDRLRELGATIVTFDEEERIALADFVRREVWPEIADEIEPELYQRLRNQFGLD